MNLRPEALRHPLRDRAHHVVAGHPVPLRREEPAALPIDRVEREVKIRTRISREGLRPYLSLTVEFTGCRKLTAGR